MTFVPVSATAKNFKLRFFKKTGSVAFVQNSLVDWPASKTGYFVAATSSTTKLCGITQFVTTASDADYTLNTLKPILVPVNGSESEVYATVASGAATDVGLRCDLTDAVTVNNGASSVGRFMVTGYKNATTLIGYLLLVAQTGAA